MHINDIEHSSQIELGWKKMIEELRNRATMFLHYLRIREAKA